MTRKHDRIDTPGYQFEIRSINKNTSDKNVSPHYLVDNISRGGLRFMSNDEFKVEDRLEITIYSPEGVRHDSTARVCYADPSDSKTRAYGLCFLEGFYKEAK